MSAGCPTPRRPIACRALLLLSVMSVVLASPHPARAELDPVDTAAEAASSRGDGYWLFAADGGMFSFGGAQFHGSLGDGRCTQVDPDLYEPGTYQTCSDMAATPSGDGYWLVDWDCNVSAFGDAPFLGDGKDGRGSAWEYDIPCVERCSTEGCAACRRSSLLSQA